MIDLLEEIKKHQLKCKYLSTQSVQHTESVHEGKKQHQFIDRIRILY